MNLQCRGRRIGLGVWLAVVLMAFGFAESASAAAVWRIDSLANSTAAPAGSLTYVVQLTNVGDASADGSASPITFTATMPAGLHATGVSTDTLNFPNWDCSSTLFPATEVTCTNSADVISRSRYATMVVSASVAVGTGSPAVASFGVSGGDPSSPSASTVDPTTITSTPPGFGVDAFDGAVDANAAGDPFTQAGGHPYDASTSIEFNSVTNLQLAPPLQDLWPAEPLRDIHVDLPPGLIGNPTGVTQCTAADVANVIAGFDARPLCAPTSQVGTTMLRVNGLGGNHNLIGPVPVFNMVPSANEPARFGFNAYGSVVILNARLRSGGDFGISIDATNVPEALGVVGTSVTLWGVPSDPSHDSQRSCSGQIYPWIGGPTCTSGAPQTAFLRNPTACTPDNVGLPTGLSIDSWEHPGVFQTGSFVSHVPPAYPAPPSDWGHPQGPTGCERVPFAPTLKGAPTAPAIAGAPSGFSFDVSTPQTDDPGSIAEGDLKSAVVTLPVGLNVSASTADGLQACSLAQIGLLGTNFPEPNRIRFDENDPTCPDGSKLGSVTIETPLLSKPITGSIYLAAPHDNPFGTLISIYLVAKGSGTLVKLPGRVDLNQSTGQTTATFDDNPQVPFTNLHLEFKSGTRAPLVAPPGCGSYTTHAVLTSWSGKTATSDSDFTLSGDGHGGPCPAQGFAPTFTAGTTNPIAGEDSSFTLALARGDHDQQLHALTVDMPLGLTGRIANAVLCSDGAANAGSCGDGSKLGSVAVAAGAGTNPFWITNGQAFITGPYRGGPFGLSIVVPAVAGPFDLGNVVVRAAIYVDRNTTQLKVVSDPLPTILQGIPLDVREVRVSIDKPHFIVNPTSCAVKQVGGTIDSTAGTVAHVSSRFQVGECASLPLAPKMTLTVGSRRHTQAGASTPFTATLTQTKGQANLRSVKVILPSTLNARLAVINRACKLAEFEAGHCSSRARAGSAVATTPLLRDPLKGSAYFVKNPARILPDLMVALRGQVDFDLVGKVSIPGGKRLGTTFDAIPDVPVTKFTLSIVSGKNGPVGAISNLCTAKAKRAAASLTFRGQNNRQLQRSQSVRVLGCPKAKKAKHKK